MNHGIGALPHLFAMVDKRVRDARNGPLWAQGLCKCFQGTRRRMKRMMDAMAMTSMMMDVAMEGDVIKGGIGRGGDIGAKKRGSRSKDIGQMHCYVIMGWS